MRQYVRRLDMVGKESRGRGSARSLISTTISGRISWVTLLVPETEVITWEGDTLAGMGGLRRSDLLCFKSRSPALGGVET
jgi:hypothetical protein